jgi:hypothetical protein
VQRASKSISTLSNLGCFQNWAFMMMNLNSQMDIKLEWFKKKPKPKILRDLNSCPSLGRQFGV